MTVLSPQNKIKNTIISEIKFIHHQYKQYEETLRGKH